MQSERKNGRMGEGNEVRVKEMKTEWMGEMQSERKKDG